MAEIIKLPQAPANITTIHAQIDRKHLTGTQIDECIFNNGSAWLGIYARSTTEAVQAINDYFAGTAQNVQRKFLDTGV